MYSSHFYTHTVHSSQVMFPFLRVEYLLYVSYLKFCMELVSSLLFITLFKHLFISIQTHECLFCNSRQNSLLLFFFCLIPVSPDWDTGNFLSQLLCSFKVAPSFFFFLSFFFFFLHCRVLHALILCIYCSNRQSVYKASLIAQLVKNLHAMQEIPV